MLTINIFAGSYKNARIGEVLASDADIGFNSEVSAMMVYFHCYLIAIHGFVTK